MKTITCIKSHIFTKHKNFLFSCLLSFLISFFIGILLLIRFHAAPFGDSSLICLDLYDQYLPLYFRQTHLSSLGGLFHSWNGALGYNNWAQSAYYCMSIFLPLYRLVPVSGISVLTDLLIVLKIALSAASCAAFLQRKTGKQSPLLVSGAVAYSLCGFSTAFFSQIMWTDLLIYTPLVLLALERLKRTGKGGAYALLLALCIISNFSIAFSLCLFLFLYFLAGDKKNWKFFFLYSLLAGGLSCFLLIPVILAVSQTTAASNALPFALRWYSSLSDYLKMMMPGQMPKIDFNGVNIFTGTVIFLTLPPYFLNRLIPRRERAANGALLVFLAVSLNLNALDFLWHGFHFPHFLPGRWTFLFSLFLIALSCQGFLKPEGLTLRRRVAGLLCGILPVAYAGIRTDIGDTVLPGYYALFVLFSVLLLLYSTSSKRLIGRRLSLVFALLLSVIQIADSGASFLQTICENKAEIAYCPGDLLPLSYPLVSSAGKEWACGEDDFYRIDGNRLLTHNCSVIGGYKGITYFSSTMQDSAYRYLSYLGLPHYTENLSLIYQPDSPVISSLLGIRYILDFDGTLDGNVTGYRLLETGGEYDVWENPDALALAFSVSDDLADLQIEGDASRSLVHQNELIRRMSGIPEDVFQEWEADSSKLKYVIVETDPQTGKDYYARTNPDREAVFSYEYTVPSEGDVFLQQGFESGDILVLWDGGS